MCCGRRKKERKGDQRPTQGEEDVPHSLPRELLVESAGPVACVSVGNREGAVRRRWEQSRGWRRCWERGGERWSTSHMGWGGGRRNRRELRSGNARKRSSFCLQHGGVVHARKSGWPFAP